MREASKPGRSEIRRGLLSEEDCFDAYLTFYPPHLRQPEHEHGCSQFSVLLSGGLTERVDGREFRAGPGQVSAKARGTAHADEYGAQGALLVSFNFRCEEAASALLPEGKWQWRSARPGSGSYTPRLLWMKPGADRNDLVWDLLAVGDEPARHSRPPEWLRWVRRQLDQPGAGPAIGSLAREAGVHRVCLTREFTRHFGLPPAAYRQRQMAGVALKSLIDGNTSAADAAYLAGFADQSHMIRTMRGAFGMTPRRLASLLAS